MIGFVHRQAGLRSVTRFARSGIDDPLHAGYSACFAKVDGAQHIAARVELGIGHRCVKIDLRGKVEDDVRVCARDDINYFRSLNVSLHQGKPTRNRVVATERML